MQQIAFFFASLWSRLVTPQPFTTDAEELHRARFAASLILALLLLTVGFISIGFFLDVGFLLGGYLASFSGLGLLVPSFYLCKVGNYRVSMFIMTSALWLSVVIVTLFNPQDVDPIMYLTIGVLLNSVFLSLRVALLQTGFNIITILMIAVVSPTIVVAKIAVPLMFNLFISVLFIIVRHYRQTLEDRKRHEIEQQYALYYSVVNAISDGILLRDQSGRILACNTRARHILNKSEETILGSSYKALFQDFVGETPRDDASVEDARQHNATLPEQRTLWMYREEGVESIQWISVQNPVSVPLMVENGVRITVIKDITAEKQIEESLIYRASLLERISDAVFLTDGDGCIQLWNRSAERLYGWKKEEVIGQPLDEILTLPNNHEHQFTFALEQIGYWTDEVVYLSKYGEAIDVDFSVTQIRNSKDEVTGMVGVARDIREKKIVERQESEYRDLLQALVAERTRQLEEINQNLKATIRRQEQVESSLRASETKNSALLNAIPEMIVVVSSNGEYREVKPAIDFPSLLPSDAYVGKKLHDLLPRAVVEKELQAISATLTTGISQIYRYDLTINGDRHSFEARTSSLNEDEVLILVRDITENARTQDALSLNESSLRMLVEITASRNLCFDEQVQALLYLGCLRLHLEIGLLTRLDHNMLNIVGSVAPNNSFEIGQNFPVHDTFCQYVLDSDEPIYLPNVYDSDYAETNLCQLEEYGTYLGIPIIVNKQAYGTLCFMSKDVSETSHKSADIDFARLLAQWISSIIEQNETQQALVLSHERYDRAVSASGAGVWEWDIETGQFHADRHLKHLLGYDEQDKFNTIELWEQLVHPQDKKLSQYAESAIVDESENSRYDIEHRVIHKNGKPRWFLERGTIIHDADGRPLRSVGVSIDITHRKRAEVAMQASEARFRGVVESMDDIVFTIDCLGNFTGFYGKWLKNFDSDPTTILGMSVFDAILTDAQFTPRTNPCDVNHIDIPYNVEWVATYDDMTRYFDFTFSPLFSGESTANGFLGVGRDVTMQKKVQLELKDAKDAAESSNRAKTMFISNMSHELRTPLNSVIGMSQLLLMRRFGDVNDMQQQYLEDIHDSGQHLLEIINDILDLGRIERGKLVLTPVNTYLEDIVSDGLMIINTIAKNKQIDVSMGFDNDQMTPIFADRRFILQVITNLLSNAVKYTQESGKVVIDVYREDTGAKVIITDTGKGIAPEHQARIFEPFERVESTLFQQSEGTGLGLALSKQLVELHGGQMGVSSRVRQGSEFWFWLPFKAEKATDH